MMSWRPCPRRRCCWSPMNFSMHCRSGNSSMAGSVTLSWPPADLPSIVTAPSSSDRRPEMKLQQRWPNTLQHTAVQRSSSTMAIHESKEGDTFQAVRGHRFSYVLDHPGEQDLTAHVDFASLAAAARDAGATASRIVSQGTWLETLGIGARAMALAAKNPQDTESISAARRRLCDEEEMGRLFKVMAVRAPSWPDVAGLES